MSAVAVLPQSMKDLKVAGFFDDFHWYISPHLWTSLSTGAGNTAVAAASTAGGNITGVTAATQNNEVGFATTNKPFLFADDKPAFCEMSLQYAEANVNTAGVAFGFGDTIGSAAFLVDTTIVPRSSWSGAVIYKITGSTVWKVRSSNGSTNTDNTTAITAGGTTAQVLRIEVTKRDTLNCQVQYFANDQQLRDATTNLPITHVLAYASLAQMQAGLFFKSNSATAETFVADYYAAYQAR